MRNFGWDQMAEWWDQQIGDEGDLWHRTLIDPRYFVLLAKLVGHTCSISLAEMAISAAASHVRELLLR